MDIHGACRIVRHHLHLVPSCVARSLPLVTPVTGFSFVARLAVVVLSIKRHRAPVPSRNFTLQRRTRDAPRFQQQSGRVRVGRHTPQRRLPPACRSAGYCGDWCARPFADRTIDATVHTVRLASRDLLTANRIAVPAVTAPAHTPRERRDRAPSARGSLSAPALDRCATSVVWRRRRAGADHHPPAAETSREPDPC